MIRRPITVPDAARTGRAVVLAGSALIAVHLAIRAWGVYGGWFYTDDFRLLFEARTSPLDLQTLLRPYDSQFMPAGRLLAWLVEESGSLNWKLAATLNLALQAATSVVCFLMLRSLFGLRLGILAPLSFYLFTAIPFPAFMWWAASLNQLPMQLSLFLAVWAWTAYLRRPGIVAALLTVAAVAFGLVFYVKTLLVLPLLGLMALAYFAQGGFLRRLWYVVRTYWLGLGALVVGAGAFTAYYLTNVPQLASMQDAATVWGLLRTYAATSFASSVLGGPWLWWQHPNPPTSQVDVPGAALAVCWVVLAGVVVATALLRRRTLRAWVMVAVYLGTSFAVLLTSRGDVGPYIGLELRYLTDVAPVVTIAIGLAYLPVVGAVESSEPRATPRLDRARSLRVGVFLLVVVCIGGVVSTYGHARTWHLDNPGRGYISHAAEGIAAQGAVVNIADKEAPGNVMIQWSYPHNLLSHLLPLTGEGVRFPRVAEELYTLDEQGILRRADVAPGVTEQKQGKVAGCGWLVRPAGRSIPLTGPVPGLEFWMRIGYLSSSDGEILLTMGREQIRVPVRGGLHDAYVRTSDEFSSIRVDGLAAGQAMCVTDVEVGPVRAGGAP